MDTFVTRFAPSPTGYLHKGHAFSALLAADRANHYGQPIHLRIEDIDQTRCRAEFIDAIYDDLAWLGIKWRQDVRTQSNHMADYAALLDNLKSRELAYPCFCTRKDILREIENAGSAPQKGDGQTVGLMYPGTCRNLSTDLVAARLYENRPFAWRLNVAAALEIIPAHDLVWFDEIRGEQKINPATFSDFILARKDTPTSYNLAVVHDDHLQGITHIIRGEDLLETTPIHILLQKLFGYETPIYHHHRLLLDENGKRFAKRNRSATLQSLREEGISVKDLRREFGL